MSHSNRSRRAAVESLESRRLLMAGIVDSSFGLQGVVLAPVDARRPFAVTRLTDGKLIIAGVTGNPGIDSSTSSIANFKDVVISRYLADATIDRSFGVDGTIALDLDPALTLRAHRATPDGGLLFYVETRPTDDSTSEYRLLKFTASGQRDRAFGDNGQVRNVPAVPYTFTPDFRPLDIASDGRIVLGAIDDPGGSHIHLQIYTAAGVPDPGVGDGGTARVAVSRDERIQSVKFDMAGRVLVHTSNVEDASAPVQFLRRLSHSGVEDRKFGRRTLPIQTGYDEGVTLQAVLPDNRMVFSHRYFDAQTLTIVRVTPGAKLDSTYGGGDGVAEIDAPRENSDVDKPLLVAPDGRIVYIYSRQREVYVDDPFGIAVIRSNGTLDPQFAGDGTQYHELPFAYRDSAAALLPDGRFVIAGATFDPVDFGMIQYGVNGKFDPSFNADGIFLPGPGSNLLGEFTDAAILPGGKILAAGQTGRGGHHDLLLARYTVGGALDQTFSDNGWLKLDIRTDDTAARLLVQPDGKYLVGGNDFVARFKTDGSLDAAFGNAGIVKIAATQIQLLSSGKIIVADGTSKLCRLNANGAPDSSFTTAALPAHLLNTKLTMLEVDSTGRFVAGGVTDIDDAVQNRGVLVRFRADGSLDPTFSDDGIAFPKQTEFELMTVRPDGGINLVNNYRTQYNGYGENYAYYYAEILQLKSNGKPDLVFYNYSDPLSRSDRTTISLGSESDYDTGELPVRDVGIRRLRVQSDGKLLMSLDAAEGLLYSYYDYAQPDSDGYDDANGSLGMMRLRADGRRDTQFSLNGVTAINSSFPNSHDYFDSFPTRAVFAVGASGDIALVGAAMARVNTVPFVARIRRDRNDPVNLSDGGVLDIRGTAGDDRVSVRQVDQTITVNSNGATFSFPAPRVRVLAAYLGDGNDRLDLRDTRVRVVIEGGAGNDTIDAPTSLGADDTAFRALVRGGEGNDLMIGGDEFDSLFGQAGNDTIRGGGENDIIEAGDGNDLVEGGAGLDHLRGDAGDDMISGDADDDMIVGGAGRDTLNGNGGDDSIVGGDGAQVYGGTGKDILSTTTGTLNGGGGDDSLYGESDQAGRLINLSFYGGAGNDRIVPTGQLGTQYISGGDGIDMVHFSGFDTSVTVSLDDQPNDGRAGGGINVTSSIENVIGGYGDDRLIGNNADNLLIGHGGNDVIHGIGGNDTLVADFTKPDSYGGMGRDSLFGGDGDDTIVSFKDSHRDRIEGGAGNDHALRDKSKDRLELIEEILAAAPADLPAP